MSESSGYGYDRYESEEKAARPMGTMKKTFQNMSKPFVQVGKALDQAIPNYRTVDSMAYSLAKRTPRAVAVCMVLLLAGIVASRLNVWTEGYLWGIPSLGAISMGVGFWVWSSNLLMRRELSPEAREVLKRAINLQLTMVVAGVLGIVYFLGMALGWW